MSFFSKIKVLLPLLPARTEEKKTSFFFSLIADRRNYEASYPGLYEIPSLPGPPNPFLLNALKLFTEAASKAQSRHSMWTPLEGSTQLPKTAGEKAGAVGSMKAASTTTSKCPSCLLRGASQEAPQGGCQLQTHRFFLSPLISCSPLCPH